MNTLAVALLLLLGLAVILVVGLVAVQVHSVAQLLRMRLNAAWPQIVRRERVPAWMAESMKEFLDGIAPVVALCVVFGVLSLGEPSSIRGGSPGGTTGRPPLRRAGGTHPLTQARQPSSPTARCWVCGRQQDGHRHA